MSFVLLEDQRRPMPKRPFVVFGSFRPLRPLYRVVRLTVTATRSLTARVKTLLRLPNRETQAILEPTYEVLPDKQS